MTDIKLKGGESKMGGCEMYCGSGSSNSNVARGFLTKQEKIQMLEDYKSDLENEAKGVSERIAEMKKDK